MRVPLRATYRVQFTNAFTFKDAEAVVPYWHDLGVSHIYASPIFESRAGSQHGYDVVDQTIINPELGGEAAFFSLADALRKAGLSLILDIVPNHMGIGDPRNHTWLDALEFGPQGPEAATFDIDWERGPVLIPFLGDTLIQALKDKALKPAIDAKRGRIAFQYFNHVLPLRPSTTSAFMVEASIEVKDSNWRHEAAGWAELEGEILIDAVEEKRQKISEFLGKASNYAALNSLILDKLDEAANSSEVARTLFDIQHWRLANWHTAQDEINYRRFFNISDLVSLRAELPAVFEKSHQLPLKLLREGIVDGLRADHVDGLSDPAAYCRQLRDAAGPDATLHVEKILDRDERLRRWPVEGTTGYELLNLINGLFIEPSGYQLFAENAVENGMLRGSVADRVAVAKRKVLTESFVSELAKVTSLAKKNADRDLETRDFSYEAIRRALVEMIVFFPVYRSYLTADVADPEDQALIDGAADAACARFDAWQQSVVRFLQQQLLASTSDETAIELKTRFQQLTAPVMAKGYEDTELYRYIVLLSVNEVGGHIADPAISVPAFHERVADQAASWPLALVPLATHDTKRGAGARARINVLSECAGEWLKAVALWSVMNKRFKTEVSGVLIPDALDEQLIYQTMLGSWPLSSERLLQYLSKAMREAKRRTSWENPNPRYEEAVTSFAKALIDDAQAKDFRNNFETYLYPIIRAGRINALAQTIIQFTFPGIPDLYWGTEFWDHAMVDPDNRRSVDWNARRHALTNQPSLNTEDICADQQGGSKIFVIKSLLEFRRHYPELLIAGRYRPLSLRGPESEQSHWLAFARENEGKAVVVVVPLRGFAMLDRPPPNLFLELPQEWCGAGRDILGSGEITLSRDNLLSDLIGARPFAVIEAG